MTSTCYRINLELRTSIESAVRSMGAQIVSNDFSCTVQFFYQQIQPLGKIVDPESPVFTMVSIDEETYAVTEVKDQLIVGTLGVPSTSIDIVKMPGSFFEKFKIFNLKNKTVKKIKFTFTWFRLITGGDIILNDDMVILDSAPGNIVAILAASPHTRCMNLNRAFVRPKVDGNELPFWIYQLAKLKERVFPTEAAPPYLEVSDCLFAKNLMLA